MLSIMLSIMLLDNKLFYFNHPFDYFPVLLYPYSSYSYPYLSFNPVKSLENPISKTINSDVFKI